jgi:hypothetical protein
MNRITRNLIVVLLGIGSSLLTAAVLVFVELRSGQSLFSETALTYVPVGAIGAGLVSAAGYYLGSKIMRLRPPNAMLIAIVAIAAGSVFVLDSIEYGTMSVNRQPVNSVGSLGEFLAMSFKNTPLKVSIADSDSDSGSASSSSTPDVSGVSNDSNPGVAGIGSGVSGMMASGNALSADNIGHSMAGLQQRLHSMKALGSGVLDRTAVFELAVLQLAGFVIGGILAFWYLRTLPFCEECQEFLSKKGEQTRYFDRERDIQNSVHDFLSAAKARRFKQSIEAHSGVGTPEKTHLSEFASTVEISQCKGCHRHRLQFSAQKKKGMSWKEISMLGYTAFCMEPIDVMSGTMIPTRIR